MHLVWANMLIYFKETVSAVFYCDGKAQWAENKSGPHTATHHFCFANVLLAVVTCFSIPVGRTMPCKVASSLVMMPRRYSGNLWKWMSLCVHADAHLVQTLLTATGHTCQRSIFGIQKSWIPMSWSEVENKLCISVGSKYLRGIMKWYINYCSKWICYSVEVDVWWLDFTTVLVVT